ncbi:MAG: RNA degradosome polyphosphate kinase, partial [Bacteroidales bacterium]
MSKAYIPKEVSWLSFNERVLQEAENREVPLMDRFNFLGIYSNNLDEYFRVRVATLKRLSLFGSKSKNILGYDPKKTLKSVQKIVIEQNTRFEKTYSDLLKELKKHNIHFVNEQQLNAEQAEFVQNYFHKEVRNRLMPLMITKDGKLPDLTDDAIYFAILIKNTVTEKKWHSLLEIPTDLLPRFIMLPGKDGAKYIIFLDDVIRFGLRDLFFIFSFDELEAYTIKLTKDAELDIADDISESYIDKLSKSLQLRKKGTPVRFVYDRNIPQNLFKTLTKKLNLGPDDVMIPGDRYHNFKDFM